MLRLTAFNQRRGQMKSAAQLRFFASHLTIIALVIEARQMKNSMQRENLHLLRRGMPKLQRILHGNFGADRNIASGHALSSWSGGERCSGGESRER